MKLPKIIFFLKGSLPTVEEKQEAESLGVKVAWRNVQYIDPDHYPEECDGVAGAVPASYEDKPSAVEALEGYQAEIEKRRKLVGDEPAPVASVATAEEVTAATAPVKNPAIKQPKTGGWAKGK